MLDKENEILLARLQEQASEIAALKGETAEAQLRMELALVKEKSDRLQKMLFGASSEKRGTTAKGRNEGSNTSARAPKTQQELPIVPVPVTLASGEDLCSACGNQLAPMAGQTEDSECVTVIQREFVVQRIERQKYSCSCGIGVVTAPAPLALVPGGRYSVEFAVHVAVDKYLMHLPLDRQRRSMMRSGLQLHCSSLWDQINALAALHEASYDRLRDYILGADVIGADETWWRLMNNRPSKRWWVWSMTVPDAIWYGIAPSRSAKTAAGFIGDFEGTIVCDAYKAYETLARQSPDIRLALCWSHARRKFVEAESHYPQCAEAIDLIGQLFALERETADPALLVGDEKLAAIDRRLRLRSDRAPPILENLRNWAYEQRGLPKSGLRRAIDYMLGHWRGLTTFLDDPFVPIHNNASERAMRSVVLGRKNHLGSKSEGGTEVAAVLYTLCETAYINGLDPYRYLVEATYAILEDPSPVPLPLAP